METVETSASNVSFEETTREKAGLLDRLRGLRGRGEAAVPGAQGAASAAPVAHAASVQNTVSIPENGSAQGTLAQGVSAQGGSVQEAFVQGTSQPEASAQAVSAQGAAAPTATGQADAPQTVPPRTASAQTEAPAPVPGNARPEEDPGALCRAWVEQAKALSRIYPDFRLDRELENREFREMLRLPGIDLPTAFVLVHRRELIPAAMGYVSRQTARMVSQQVASGGRRPQESGAAGSSAASQVKTDVRKLTKAQREDIAQRAARGERVTF